MLFGDSESGTVQLYYSPRQWALFCNHRRQKVGAQHFIMGRWCATSCRYHTRYRTVAEHSCGLVDRPQAAAEWAAPVRHFEE